MTSAHMGFLELLEYKEYLENIGLRQKLAEIASSSLYLKRESAKRPFRLFFFQQNKVNAKELFYEDLCVLGSNFWLNQNYEQ